MRSVRYVLQMCTDVAYIITDNVTDQFRLKAYHAIKT